MSTAYPLPRQIRQVTLTATASQTIFGPSDFILFDPADVQIWVKPAAQAFTLLASSQYSIAPAAPATGFPAFFTVTLTTPRAAGDLVRISGARLPARTTDVTRGGVLQSQPLETELDRQVATAQELRRDVSLVADKVSGITDFVDVYQGPKAADPVARDDGSPLQKGDVYFNTTVNQLRFFDAGAWRSVTDQALNISFKSFTGNGVVTTFVLDAAPGVAHNLFVEVAGALKKPAVDYTVSGTVLTFAVAPANAVTINTWIFGTTAVLAAPTDGSVSTSKIVDGAVTAPKLADGAVSTPKLADASITPPKVAPSLSAYLDTRYPQRDYLDTRYAQKASVYRGSFIPFIKGGTSAGVGTYTKQVGTYHYSNGWVDWVAEIIWTAHTGTGDLMMGGLPETVKSINSPLAIASAGVAFTGDDFQGVALAGTTDCLFQNRTKAGGQTAVPIASAGTLRVSGSYPTGPNAKIVFMGDSVTLGVRPGVLEGDTFRRKVQNALGWIEGVNKGVGGENASEMRARFGADVFTSGANACCVMSGINDFYDPLPVPTFTSKMQEMIDAAAAASIKFTLCSCNATTDPVMLAGFGPYLTATQNLKVTNPAIIYVPVYEAFINYKNTNGDTAFAALFTDGQHPNPAGHDLITATILATPGACLP